MVKKKEIRAYNTVAGMGNVVSAITTLIDCVGMDEKHYVDRVQDASSDKLNFY